MKIANLKKFKLPNSPGVYFFQKGKGTLYIGKATSLKDRVRSYFGKDLIQTRGPHILDMVVQANNLDWQKTDSVLEALILEAELIKKHLPKYNTSQKDNKSWNYVCITREKLPKVLVVRGRKLDRASGSIFGPFTNGSQLREAMKIIRRIFPFIDVSSSKRQNFEFYKQLGLVPPITSPGSAIQKVLGSPRQIPLGARPDHFEKHFLAALLEYKKNISNLKLFFQGKKKKIILNLKKEMLEFAKNREFEKANEIKKRIFALQHINDTALIKNEIFGSGTSEYRIEAYDIAHMSGKNMVGVMTVVENGQPFKQEYKKFIIKTQTGANDTGALEEVLSRRFRHTEWGLPSLVVVDGSTAQVNVARKVLKRYQFDIPIVAVVKDDKHKAKAIIGDEKIIKEYKKSILLANSESHRFAITYHKQKRDRNFLK